MPEFVCPVFSRICDSCPFYDPDSPSPGSCISCTGFPCPPGACPPDSLSTCISSCLYFVFEEVRDDL